MLEKLEKIIRSSKNIVFFGGAGVSTESGIPDFRSAEGLYTQSHLIPPEEILSHHFFMAHPEDFYAFYRSHMVYPLARPNPAHEVLADWEKEGRLTGVITQNIDGLHQLAGSKKVWELHGSIHRNRCMACSKSFGLEAVLGTEAIPLCSCGGWIKPEVVLYEEPLDEEVVLSAIEALSEAEVLLVAGTSLGVYPAAGLLQYFRGKHLVLINKTPTPMDKAADVVIHGAVGEALSTLKI